MRKLRLNIDALEVESFDTLGGPGEDAGTVQAHAGVAEPVEPGDYEAITTPYTQWKTCPVTCAASCWGTCNASCATCPLGDTCMTGCFNTCPTGGPVCCT